MLGGPIQLNLGLSGRGKEVSQTEWPGALAVFLAKQVVCKSERLTNNTWKVLVEESIIGCICPACTFQQLRQEDSFQLKWGGIFKAI